MNFEASVCISNGALKSVGSRTEHLYILEEMFTRLQKAGLKVNASKSCFGAQKSDYLVYHVTCDGAMLFPKKVETIQALAVPKTGKKLHQFIGMINFYRDMWQKRSELLAPLTALTSKNVKYDWKDERQVVILEHQYVFQTEH